MPSGSKTDANPLRRFLSYAGFLDLRGVLISTAVTFRRPLVRIENLHRVNVEFWLTAVRMSDYIAAARTVLQQPRLLDPTTVDGGTCSV